MSGYGGLGGMGMMGLGGFGMGMGMGMSGMAPDSFVFKSMRFMESASFLVSSVSMVSRSVEGHADGISNLYSSIVGLCSRIRSWIVQGFVSVKDALLWVVNRVLVLLKLRKEVIQTEPATEGLSEDEIELLKLRKRERLLGIALQLVFVGVVGMLIVANLKGSPLSPVLSADAAKMSQMEAIFQAHNKA